MTTIDEIARLARVSPATVSKVLNNRPYVSRATRERIEQVIAATGFVPSQRARWLGKRRSFILGLLIPYTSDQLFADPHLLEIMRGIEAEAITHEYNLLLSTAMAPPEAASAFSRLLRGDVIDGAVVVETIHVQPFAETLGQQPHPWVVIGYPRHSAVAAVHADDYGGALAAMGHLLALGHRRIGVISSGPGAYALEERLRGVASALAGAGLALDEGLLATGDLTIESGERGAHELFSRPEPPTAIFALNDRMALGALRAARERGLSVPGDLSVVGFDDIFLSALLAPALTTIRQPGYRLGAAAAAALFRLLNGEPEARPDVIATELIVRGTTAPPREGR
jgi:DNA-binding LacI/PurR family transcriptional regulator